MTAHAPNLQAVHRVQQAVYPPATAEDVTRVSQSAVLGAPGPNSHTSLAADRNVGEA